MEDLEIGFGDRLAALLLFSAVTYKLMPTSLYLLFCISFIGFLIWRQWQGEKYWRQRGISGPETSLLLGNTIELLRTGPINFDQQNFAKFGRAYGAFVFGRRFLMTMDAEMMKRVLVKDFSHFHQRWNPGQMPDDGSDEHEPNFRTHNVAMITGEDWRRVRNLITPAFTTGKLKRMLPNLQESAHRLCECIEKDFISPQKEIPLKELFSRLVLDQIGRGGFSLDLNTFEEGGGEPNLFIQNASKFFAMDSNRWIAMFPFICYSLKKWLKIDVTTNSSIRFFYKFMSDLYEQRKADPEAKEKYNDIFQLLMNVVNEGTTTVIDSENGNVLAEDADIIHREIWAAKGSAKQLSPGELFANAITIMVAGYDTTASALNFMFFLLARHPEQQERLREEICEVLGDETQISHEHLKRMHYLHAVVRETLRIYSPVPQTNRECMADIDVEGIALQKGDIVGIPVHAIHRSELFYEEPEKFMPERWLPGANNIVSNPLAFLTFGYGPRNCIGMRVAEFQMYVTVATLLRRFRFRPGPNTPQHPVQLESMANGLVQPVQPIFVMVDHLIV